MIRSELKIPERLITDTTTLRPNYAKYTAEPFERGFGTTLGNAFRRILLSSIKGTAITAIRIEKVLHEYSTIAGVKEDVVQIILNLKEIRFRLETDETVLLTLSAAGSGEVTAADIRPNALVEIINPDGHIATLDKCDALEIELYLQTGRGYSLAEERIQPRNAIGLIPVDANFSPVEKVNFWVEETRVGDMINFDRLNLEVWTDASITPKEAVMRAANVLIQQFELFTEFDETYVEPEPEIDQVKLRRDRYLEKPVSELDLSVRAANCLKTADIGTIRQLVMKKEREMLEYKNFGKTSLDEIKEQLNNMELTFGMSFDDENGDDDEHVDEHISIIEDEPAEEQDEA